MFYISVPELPAKSIINQSRTHDSYELLWKQPGSASRVKAILLTNGAGGMCRSSLPVECKLEKYSGSQVICTWKSFDPLMNYSMVSIKVELDTKQCQKGSREVCLPGCEKFNGSVCFMNTTYHLDTRPPTKIPSEYILLSILLYALNNALIIQCKSLCSSLDRVR